MDSAGSATLQLGYVASADAAVSESQLSGVPLTARSLGAVAPRPLASTTRLEWRRDAANGVVSLGQYRP
jgi:hypothetical protein